MDDLNDIFYTEKSKDENEAKIMQNDSKIEIDKIKTMAFNEGYIDECDKEYPNLINEGMERGKNYSLDFGKLLGMIEAVFLMISLNENCNIEEKDITMLNEIKNKLENFQEKIDENLIRENKEKIQKVIDKIKENI